MGRIVNKIAIYLNRHLTGNVFDKDSVLDAYSTDQSLIKIKPRFVALPETTADVRKLVRFSNQLVDKKYSLPISVRGSGLSKTGADLSSGLVISTEKLDHVRELDAHDRLIHVQAGITLGKLNAVLAPHGLTLPVHADPRETIGALIANSPRDHYSKRYGGIMNYVDRVEFVLASGDLVQTSRLSSGKLRQKQGQKNLEGEIYEKLDSLLTKNRDLIANLSKNTRLGYSGLRHIRRNHDRIFDLLPVLFGSEGSLGIITEVILRLEVMPPRSHRLLAVFPSFDAAQKFMNTAEKLSPLSTMLYDTRIYKALEDCGKKPDLLNRKFGDGFVVIVSFNDKSSRSRRKVHKLLRTLPRSSYSDFETVKNSPDFDEMTACLATFLNETGKGERPNLLNDFFVPAENFPAFLEDLEKLEKTFKRPLALHGCYSTGVYSLRPDFDLKKVDERRAAITILRDFNELLLKHGGSLAGGSPEGRLKSLVIYPGLDKKEKKLYEEVKAIFDKNNVFASNIKTDYNIQDTIKHLRVEPNSGLTV